MVKNMLKVYIREEAIRLAEKSEETLGEYLKRFNKPEEAPTKELKEIAKKIFKYLNTHYDTNAKMKDLPMRKIIDDLEGIIDELINLLDK